jgi:hypothetical protein
VSGRDFAYNVIIRHGTLHQTPAMHAGLAGHPWKLAE